MFLFLFSFGSAVVRKIRQCLSTRSVIAMVLLLCLLMASCDVRPFSDFGNDDSTEDMIDDMTDDQDNDDVPDSPAKLDLDLSASPIAVEVGFEATTQVNIGQRDPEGTYQFAITTRPSIGTATINSETGRLTFTSETATDSDRLIVTVTETINNVETGFDTIEIPITVVAQ